MYIAGNQEFPAIRLRSNPNSSLPTGPTIYVTAHKEMHVYNWNYCMSHLITKMKNQGISLWDSNSRSRLCCWTRISRFAHRSILSTIQKIFAADLSRDFRHHTVMEKFKSIQEMSVPFFVNLIHISFVRNQKHVRVYIEMRDILDRHCITQTPLLSRY